jgi:hypothetical protein
LARRVFIGFQKKDRHAKELLKAQAKNENLDIEFNDQSPSKPYSSKWKTKMKKKICNSSASIFPIGKDTYKSKAINWEIGRSRKCGAIKDVNTIAAVIATNEDGSPNFDVKLITDIESKVNKSNLKGLIKELFEGEHETALFYFSGHGFLNDLGGYVVTSDHTDNDEGISMDDILLTNNSKIKNKIIILDCCHSGKFGEPNLISDNNKTLISKGVTILTASRDSESAVEVNGQGIFTALLLQALNGGASDLRGSITPGSMYAYIDQALGPWNQRPVFKTNVSEFIHLRTINPPIPLETLRKITNYFKSPEEKYLLNPSHEFSHESKIENNAKIFKDLQKFEGVGLVIPVDEEHMYYAAINSKSCKLTTLGLHYWRLVKNKKI